MIRVSKSLVVVLLSLLSFTIISVSAHVYETAQQAITQNIKELAIITLKNSALGNLEEGQTLYYTKSNMTSLGAAISVTTTKANVYLHLNSDVDSLSTYYTTYNIDVKYATVPVGSSHSVGQTACTLLLTSPDYHSINLDVAGFWAFDFEITTTATSVSADQATTVTIVVLAESTS